MLSAIKIPKPNIERITWLSFFLYLFIASFAKHSLFFQLAVVFFLVMGTLFMLSRKKMYTSIYFLLSLMFIFYFFSHTLLGFSVQQSNSYSMLITLSINFIISFMLFNFIVGTNNIERILKLYSLSAFFGLIIIIIISGGNIFTGRLAFAWGEASYTIFGQSISISPNGIAFNLTTAFLFTFYYYTKSDNKKVGYLIYMLSFVVGILLTGSRKGLLFLLVGFFLLINILFPKRKIVTLLVSVFMSTLVIISIYEIPVLYNIIGQRLGDLLSFATGNEVLDASIKTRTQLIDMGIELFKEKPLLGYGLDSFRMITPYGIVSDNNYLELLVCGGLIGLIIYYLPIINLLIKYKNINNNYNVIFKTLLIIIFLNMFLEFGSVTYYERSYMFITVFAYSIVKLQNNKEINK